jgi:spermidine dehydrogenase
MMAPPSFFITAVKNSSGEDMNGEDRDLGMGRPISRRDFVQGVAVATTGLAAVGGPAAVMAQTAAGGAPSAANYPPLRTGMRGMHPGAFEAAHALRDGQTFASPESTGETYDLVVVGGGLSGLAAAYFFRKVAGPSARILILDNHDDFGGHAKRNEFYVNGRQYIANGGSAYLVAPPQWTRDSLSLLDDLGVDWKNPRYPRRRGLETTLPLGPATYFNKEHYGRDQLVAGGSVFSPTAEYLARTPLSPKLREEVLRLYTGKVDYMAGMSADEKIAKLRSMSYRDYLLNVAKFSPELLAFSRGAWCLGNDMCTAWFAFFRFRPGFDGLGLQRPNWSPEGEEHRAADFNWVAGNSDLARLIVRSLIPSALAAGAWQAVEHERVNYAVLDQPSSPARIRLSSIVVSAKHIGPKPPQFEPEGREVEVAYISGGRLKSVVGKHVIMACMNNVVPYLCPDMPEQQKAALRQAVRAVNQQTAVLFRNWEAFAKLKTSSISAPNNFFGSMNMNGGTLVGSMQPVTDPSQPIMVGFGTGANSGVLSNPQMVSDLCGGNPPPVGTPIDDQFRIVRNGMLATPFETWERKIRTMAAGALSSGGFDPARDILAITVNRWPHGFATGRNVLEAPNAYEELSPTIVAKQKFGRIAICNSDAAGQSLAGAAIEEAYRAVNDLQPKSLGFYEIV